MRDEVVVIETPTKGGKVAEFVTDEKLPSQKRKEKHSIVLPNKIRNSNHPRTNKNTVNGKKQAKQLKIRAQLFNSNTGHNNAGKTILGGNSDIANVDFTTAVTEENDYKLKSSENIAGEYDQFGGKN